MTLSACLHTSSMLEMHFLIVHIFFPKWPVQNSSPLSHSNTAGSTQTLPQDNVGAKGFPPLLLAHFLKLHRAVIVISEVTAQCQERQDVGVLCRRLLERVNKAGMH